MTSEALTYKVASLVDLLRENPNAAVSLAEVASTTEVLISIMQRYFNSLDVSLYRDFRNLSKYIHNAKGEIFKLRPDELKTERLPRAGKQLDAVVKATEEATQSIMDAAEEMMSAERSDAEAYAASVEAACMRIFEACAVQDITGQRITKVLETLAYIEARLDEIQKIWGSVVASEAEDDDLAAGDERVVLSSGSQLDGEGNDQAQVDALFD